MCLITDRLLLISLLIYYYTPLFSFSLIHLIVFHLFSALFFHNLIDFLDFFFSGFVIWLLPLQRYGLKWICSCLSLPLLYSINVQFVVQNHNFERISRMFANVLEPEAYTHTRNFVVLSGELGNWINAKERTGTLILKCWNGVWPLYFYAEIFLFWFWDFEVFGNIRKIKQSFLRGEMLDQNLYLR